MSGSICPACGHGNEPTANFCSSCGARLELSPDEVTAAMEAVPDSQAAATAETPTVEADMLVVLEGRTRGSRFALDKPVTTAGRHPDSDIFLDDITVSRRHAEFREVGTGFEVADVGSLNGTYVNRTLVESAALTHGDEIQVGKFKLVYLTGEDP